MQDETAVTATSRMTELLFGPRLTHRLPARVEQAIRAQDDQSEILICLVQLAAIVFFGAFYAVTPKGFGPEVTFQPIPITLAAYGAFTLLRLRLATRGSLSERFLAVSVIVDITVLMVTIWSFHLQYQQPPAVYLKAPTLLYVFIIIALRALRFDSRWVLLAGAASAIGWIILLAYVVWGKPMATMVTHNFAEYATSSKLLVGAEVDKIISIVVVSLLLALAIQRARRTLVKSVVEATAAAELSRFFAPDVAAAIVGAPQRIEPGEGVMRNATIMFIDLRGFTSLASMIEPTALVALLGDYHATVLPVVRRRNGSVITYLGDGIMITFGATKPSATSAADALRATEELLEALEAWARHGQASGLPYLKAGIGVTHGPVVCGAIGTEGRLEYATIGDPVNRAARLQGLTKSEQVPALVASGAWDEAVAQGFVPRRPFEPRTCSLAGIGEPVTVVAIR